jgi:hypothetical protein
VSIFLSWKRKVTGWHIRAMIWARGAWGITTHYEEVVMRHQTLDQLHAVAGVQRNPIALEMTRTQRLERWAELLERQPNRILGALGGTEYRSVRERDVMRGDTSPISVAFEDPVLRALGLKDDTYGEAKRFFGLTDHQLHKVVCYCHVGATMQSNRAAQCVRAAIAGRGFFARLWEAFR